jgi:hypothetical protein
MLVSSAPSGVCQAIEGCRYPAYFEGRAVGTADQRLVRRSARACGSHMGALVQIMSSWAREGNLTQGRLTVLAIEPTVKGRRPDPGSPASRGFAFTSIPIP